MSSANKLAQKLSIIATAWPKDPFRPNMQLANFLQSLATHPNLTPNAVEAAVALQSNAIMQKYPLSPKMLQPVSQPQYYTRLVEAHEKSSQGIGRPWWKVFFGVCSRIPMRLRNSGSIVTSCPTCPFGLALRKEFMFRNCDAVDMLQQ